MIADLTIRLAAPDDIMTVVDLWNDAQRWLASKGLDQWQYPVKVHNIEKAVDEKSCWLFEIAPGEAIATVTLNEDAGKNLWVPSDHPEDALYVHRLVVRHLPEYRGLGSEILDWASNRAAEQGKGFLRLDAWTSNPALHAYYLARGFRRVRVVADEPSGSGALFERAAGGL